MEDSIYTCKDGRMRVYVRETKKVMSYPKYLMEKALGRALEINEEVHHKDENPLNNNLSNLEIRIHGEHQAEHSTKYRDTTAICGWCGKEFLWTGPKQRKFYSNRRSGTNSSELPFCSRQCSGRYGQQLQMEVYHGNSPRRKLTDEQVAYIREHYVPYDEQYGCTALADKFGVHRRVIHGIVHYETYRDR